MTDIIFCDSRRHAEQVIPLAGDAKRLVLPLTPAAAALLARAGIPYKRMEDFYSEDELCRGCEGRLGRLTHWADWIDGRLREGIPEFRAPAFSPARLHFFFLAWLANALFFRAYALARLAEAVRPARVTWFEERLPPDNTGADLGFWTSRISLWRLVIPRWVDTLGVDARSLTLAPEPDPAIQPARRPSGVLGAAFQRHRSVIVREGVTGYVRRVLAGLTSPVTRWMGRRIPLDGSVLFLQDGYDLGPVRPALRRRGQRCGQWTDLAPGAEQDTTMADLKARLARLWEHAEAEPELTRPFVAEGVDLWPVAAPRLRRFWREVVPQMYAHFIAARDRFSRRRPSAIITPYAEEVWQAPTLEAARSLGIPTIVYQHGGFNGACELAIWRETDRYVADYLLVYGDGVRAYLDEDDAHRGRPRATTVVVGSARLDALRRRATRRSVRAVRRPAGARRHSRPVVLYIPYMLRGNLRFLSCDDYPDVWFYELQVRVIELFREFRHVHFLYKGFNDALPNPLLSAIASAENVTAIPYLERRVTTVMWGADLIVLDIPSTALLECLLTPKPLVVFADSRSLRMRPEAKERLRRRCPLAETPEEFLSEIRRQLERGEFPEIDCPDDAFLRAYGTHLNDGRSAERAAAAILEIAQAARQRRRMAGQAPVLDPEAT